MNGQCISRDEILERLWCMRERGEETVAGLRTTLGETYDPTDLEQLIVEDLAERQGEEVKLTPRGTERAGKLIRAHRLGERLIHDVFGREYEPGACEFEHIVNTAIVDGICTLLGHPRECPHGFPIPEGDCCRKSAWFARRIIVPLTELAIGQSARIAYVYSKSDQQLHRLVSLQIKPGSMVKLHQLYPACVIECEGANIALDAEVARSVNVWIDSTAAAAAEEIERPASGRPSFAKPGWRWRSGRRSPQG